MDSKRLLSIFGVLLLIVFSFAIAPFLGNPYWSSVLIMIVINILLTSSLRTIFILDEVSLGQVGFTLIGAYVSALVVMELGLSFWAGLILGGVASAFIAMAVGYPFMKLKGIYFSILTLMTTEILRLIAYSWKPVTGGQYGLTGIPSPNPLTLPGIGEINFSSMNNYYYLALTIVLVCLFIMYIIEKSHLSRKWIAIKDADNLALSVGINVMKYKVLNFTIACFFAGLAGGLFAHYQGLLSAGATGRFGVMTTLNLVIYMVIGGKSKFSGPIIGTIAIMLLMEFARPLDNLRPMLVGAVAIIFVLLLPEGIAGLPVRLKSIGKKYVSGVLR
ncbi:MAG: branched-chain amino acid ABC transporter permease [Desulfobacteraceae bacterium]|nr:branched-chain amino acid ABC transporter permease [Desulfobacteraceae bacterium]